MTDQDISESTTLMKRELPDFNFSIITSQKHPSTILVEVRRKGKLNRIVIDKLKPEELASYIIGRTLLDWRKVK